MMVRSLRVSGSIALPLLVALSACGDGATGPDATADGRARVTLSAVSTQVVVGGGGAATAAAAALLTDGQGNTLELTRVALVIREIELERQFDECEDDSSNNCEEFEVGPFLLELPLDGGVIGIGDVEVPAGIYDELEFEVHKPSDDTPDDLAFLEAYPEFKDVSIRVEGVFNGGDPFIFLQDLNEDQEIDLDPPLEVTAELLPLNLTLELDVSLWFRDASGTLVDPVSANKGGENESLVEENIKRSIELFEDDDRDGQRDDDSD